MNKSRLNNHFKLIFSDQEFQYVFICAVLMTICHVFMYIDSGYQIEPLIRICYCAVFFIMSLVYGRRWFPFQFLIVGFSVMYFNKWNNPTSFLLIAFVALMYQKWKKVLFISYGFAVAICLCIGHRNWAHAVLHILYCAGVYLLLLYIRKSFQNKYKLKLNDDEKEILSQMEAGKLKKEIEGYSKNTITSKIQSAMERNGCSSEGELLFRYKYLGSG